MIVRVSLPDIICVQETKLTRSELSSELAICEGWCELSPTSSSPLLSHENLTQILVSDPALSAHTIAVAPCTDRHFLSAGIPTSPRAASARGTQVRCVQRTSVHA